MARCGFFYTCTHCTSLLMREIGKPTYGLFDLVHERASEPRALGDVSSPIAFLIEPAARSVPWRRIYRIGKLAVSIREDVRKFPASPIFHRSELVG